MKKCNRCLIEKTIDNFVKSPATKDGLFTICKACKKMTDKKYSQSPAGKIARAKAWKKYSSKPEVREKRNKQRREPKRWKKEYQQKRNRLKIDPLYKLSCSIRQRLGTFLRTNKMRKTGKFKDYIGCTKDELKNHFEKQFKDGMCWENHGEWHIDHIIPLCSAKTEEELYKLCHFSNLQPLWAIDNLSKANSDKEYR